MDKLPLCLVADNVRSQHNVGAFFRTADAFRLDAIYLCGITPVPPHSDIHKTALGAELSVDWHYNTSTTDTLRRLKQDGWIIIALEQAHGSIPLGEYHIEEGSRIALVAGNEVEGVSEEVLELCDNIIEIPQQGTKHSLNVSVSVGIALYTLFMMNN